MKNYTQILMLINVSIYIQNIMGLELVANRCVNGMSFLDASKTSDVIQGNGQTIAVNVDDLLVAFIATF